MQFLHSEFKAMKGERIRVSVDQPARVLLMDRHQYKYYTGGVSFKYRGGDVDDRHEFDIPQNGVWHLVVELGPKTNKKQINATVEKIVAED